VKRFLGEGGKKKVYLAHDSLLDRDVAFALIKTDGLNDASRTRVTREAQAMGRLGSHPHIVTVFDLGEEPPSTSQGEGRDGGQPYMVTELMGGGDVEGAIEKAEGHKLPLEQALRIAIETCQGLEFAHQRGIVHRDLKPGNVWLTVDGVAKIGDFGLAVAIDRSRLTREGMMVGTVSYMPPEQATGGTVDARSDLYSLGAMIYEMVCGRPPFVGDDSVAIIGQHLNTPPVAPSWHRPDLPTTLEALILRLLEKDPSKRPASASEVRQALESVDLSEPVGVGLKPAPTNQDNPLYRRTFVGREQELRQLQSAFDAAISGSGSLVMVVGEPGIGKTAVCEQLATYVGLRGGKALMGHCYEEGSLSLPYLAFVEAMRSYVLAREPEGLKSDLGTGAAEVARIVSEVRDRVQVELRPSGDPEDDRYRLLQAVTTFLRNASTVQPLLIILEDLHWADRGTLDLLLHVARNMQGARLLIVGTYRDVEVDRSHPLSATLAELRRASNFQRVPLRGLTVDEVQRMMSAIRGQEATWSRAEAIYRQTEGNPLFIQEVLRYLVEAGLVVREGGRYVRTDDGSPEAGIPEGLRDVIGKRLSRLGPECNRVLSMAAVIGREFRLDVLQRVAGVSEDELYDALGEAKGVGVVEERSAVGTGVTYRFAHAFFRQTLYEETIAPRRIRLHQEVARALEAVYGRRLEEHASELAEHFSYSSGGDDLAKAVQYGEMAAKRALGVFAYGEAAGHLERCLQVQEVLDPDDRTKRCDLLLALGEALMPGGEPQRVYETVAEEAYTIAEAVQDGERAARASLAALEALMRYGNAAIGGTPTNRLWVERADRYAQPGTTARVYADLALAAVRGSENRYAQANAFRVQALEQARLLEDPNALFRAANVMMDSGGTVRQMMEELLRLAEEFSHRPREGVSSLNLAWFLYRSSNVFLEHGQRERAEALYRDVRALGGRVRDPLAILRPMANEGILALVDGHLEEAVALGASLAARAEELGSPVFGRQFATAISSRPLLYLGQAEETLAALPLAVQLAGIEEGSVASRGRQALLLAHLGRAEEAAALLRGLPVHLTTPGPEGDEAPAQLLTNLLEAAVVLGERELAALLAKRLAPVASLAVVTTLFTTPARHLGAAMALLGKPDEARAYYQQALEAAGKIRFRPEIALTRLQLAELLLDEAKVGAIHELPLRQDAAPVGAGLKPAPTKEALGHLDFAIAEFRAMKMQPSLERALRHREILRA
jgi:serine/threonine protein kinase